MSPYRTDTMAPEEEVDYLRRLLASAEARLAASRGPKATPLSGDSKSADGLDAILSDWRSFWKDNFNLDLDFTTLRIPPQQEGFNRLLIMLEGMTANRLYAKCAELFPCWRYMDNLNTVTSDRDPTKLGTYAIWARDRVEADEELKSKSANDLREAGVKGETLPERLLHELKYFTETKEHLDVRTITLCSGSRDPHGGVPDVRWRSEGGEMGVGWYIPARRGVSLRVRAVVS